MTNKIENINFHDSSLDKLEINFEKSIVCFTIGVYNDEQEDYDNYNLICQNIEQFEIINALKTVDYSAEIKDLNVLKTNDKKLKLEINLITGKGTGNHEITLISSEININLVK